MEAFKVRVPAQFVVSCKDMDSGLTGAHRVTDLSASTSFADMVEVFSKMHTAQKMQLDLLCQHGDAEKVQVCFSGLRRCYGRDTARKVCHIMQGALRKGDPRKVMRKCIGVLELIHQQRAVVDASSLHILKSFSPQHWQQRILEYTSKLRSQPRTLEDLCKLMQQDAHGINSCLKEILKGQFPQLFQDVSEIKERLLKPSAFVTENGLKDIKIQDYGEKEIHCWIAKMESYGVTAGSLLLDYNKLKEAIAVFSQGVNIKRHYHLRDAQIITMWVFLSNQGNRGRLGQVATGEGKSLIIAGLATLCSLGGRLLHIVTSTSELAKRDCCEQQDLFSLFQRTACNNCDNAAQEGFVMNGVRVSAVEVRRDRYMRNGRPTNIVYGHAGSFQGDILQTEFFMEDIIHKDALPTAKPSGKHLVIIDEVDSMLLDNANMVLYLSHAIESLRTLERVFVEIWKEVNDKDFQGATAHDETAVECITEAIRHQLMCGQLVVATNEACRDSAPFMLMKAFIDRKLPDYVRSAFVAKRLKRNDCYVLVQEDGSVDIRVVDKATGMEMRNMHWTNGLHQFLQLRFAQRVSPEGLKAVYMSNVAFFQRYGANVFGLTGTLGSAAEQDVLASAFGIDFFRVPRFKPELFHFLAEPQVLQTRELWFQALRKRVKELAVQPPEANGRRAVLLICENVEDVLAVSKVLKPSVPNLVAYHSNRDNLNVDELKPGDVIVATNLAGRGTDLRTSKALENNGGLHVILTYMPGNIRIQDQAFGRTARKGNRGTGEFIVMDAQQRPVEALLKERDENEKKRLASVVATELPRIKIEEDLLRGSCDFEGFATLLKHVEAEVSNKNLNEPQLQRQSLLNRWAFLDSVQSLIQDAVAFHDKKTLQAHYTSFADGVKSDLAKGNLIHEASECILLGNRLRLKEHWTEARDEYAKAARDPGYSFSAYFSAACGLNANYQDGGVNARKTFKRKIKQVLPCIEAEVTRLMQALSAVAGISEQQRLCGTGLGPNHHDAQMQERMTLWNIFREMISQAVGSDICVEELKNSPHIADLKEARALLDHLVKKAYIKARRCSLKVKPPKKPGEPAQVKSKDGSLKPLRFPASLEGLEPAISEILLKKVEERKAARKTCPSRPQGDAGELTLAKLQKDIESHGVELPTRKAVWNLLMQLEVIKPDSTVTVQKLKPPEKSDEKSDEEWWKADALKVEGASADQQEALQVAVRSLMQSHGGQKMLKAEMIDLLQTTSSELLTAVRAQKELGGTLESGNGMERSLVEVFHKHLLAEKYLVQSQASKVHGDRMLEKTLGKDKTVHLSSDQDELQKQLRQCLRDEAAWKRHALLRSLVVQGPASLAFPDGYVTARPFIAEEDICVEDGAAVNNLYEALLSLGVVKMESFNLSGQADKDCVKTFMSDLKADVEKFLKDRKGDKLKEAVESVMEILQGHLGSLRQLPAGSTVASFVEIKDRFFIERKKLPPEALDEFIAAGLDCVFELQEKKEPAKWWEIAAVILMGICQIALGVLAQTFIPCVGHVIGDFLISTGIDDICFGIQCAISGEFSWEAYGEHKAQSLMTSAISAVCFGAAKFAGQVVKLRNLKAAWKLTKMSKAQAMTKAAGAMSQQLGKNVGANVLKSAGKEIASTLLTTGLTELAGWGIDSVLNATSGAYEEDLRKAVAKAAESAWPEVEQALRKLCEQLGHEKDAVETVSAAVIESASAAATQKNGVYAAFQNFGSPAINGAAKGLCSGGKKSKFLSKGLEGALKMANLGVAIGQLSTTTTLSVMRLADDLRHVTQTKQKCSKVTEDKEMSEEQLKEFGKAQRQKFVNSMTSMQKEVLKSELLAPILKTGVGMLASHCVTKTLGSTAVEQIAEDTELMHSTLEYVDKGKASGAQRIQAFLAGAQDCTKQFRKLLEEAERSHNVEQKLNKIPLQNCDRVRLGELARGFGAKGLRVFEAKGSGQQPVYFVVHQGFDGFCNSTAKGKAGSWMATQKLATVFNHNVVVHHHSAGSFVYEPGGFSPPNMQQAQPHEGVKEAGAKAGKPAAPVGKAGGEQKGQIVLRQKPGLDGGLGHMMVEVTDPKTGKTRTVDVPQRKNQVDCLFAAAIVGNAVLEGHDVQAALKTAAEPKEVKKLCKKVADAIRNDKKMKAEYYRLHSDQEAAKGYLQHQAGASWTKDGKIRLHDADVRDYRGRTQEGGRPENNFLPVSMPNAGRQQTLSQHHVAMDLHEIIAQMRREMGLNGIHSDSKAGNKRLKVDLETYLNHPNNKQLLKSLKWEEKQTANFLKSESMGPWLYAAVTYNPNNLNYGPAPHLRYADPGHTLDHWIFNLQPKHIRRQWRQALNNPNMSILEKLSCVPMQQVYWKAIPNAPKPWIPVGLVEGKHTMADYDRKGPRGNGLLDISSKKNKLAKGSS